MINNNPDVMLMQCRILDLAHVFQLQLQEETVDDTHRCLYLPTLTHRFLGMRAQLNTAFTTWLEQVTLPHQATTTAVTPMQQLSQRICGIAHQYRYAGDNYDTYARLQITLFGPGPAAVSMAHTYTAILARKYDIRYGFDTQFKFYCFEAGKSITAAAFWRATDPQRLVTRAQRLSTAANLINHTCGD